jgi:hypothetical protein
VMRRPFIVMEANPKKFPQSNNAGPRALSDFLLSDRVQKFLLEFGKKTAGAEPLFSPSRPRGAETPLERSLYEETHSGGDNVAGGRFVHFRRRRQKSDELNQYRTFIQEHPRVLEELKKDPSLLGMEEFAQAHKVVGEYLAKHVGIAEQVKGVPHFFDDLKATTKGGEHRQHPDGKSK